MDALRTSAAVLWFGSAALALAACRHRRYVVSAVLAAVAATVMGLWHTGLVERFLLWAAGRAMPAQHVAGLIAAALLCGALVAVLIRPDEGFDARRPHAPSRTMARPQSDPHTRAPVRDLHRRVEANLAIAAGLLDVTAQHTEGRCADALARCRGRISALSAVHGALAGETDPAAVEFEPLVRRLAAPIYRMLGVGADRIRLVVDSSPAVPAPLAVPCALLLHELLANALAHAFGPDQRGQIRAGFSGSGEEGWMLTVRDNGVGRESNSHTTEGGGGALMRSLAESLGGRLHAEDDGGLVCTVVLPAQPAGELLPSNRGESREGDRA